MIDIDVTRYQRKDGHLTHRRTTSTSEEKAIVVLSGRHGRYVLIYDELVGCELSVSDDVTMIRADQDFSEIGGGIVKRWTAKKGRECESHPAPSSTIYPVRDPHQTLELATTRAAANRLATTLITKQKPFTVKPVFVDGGVPAWEFVIVEENEPSRHEAA